MKRIEQIIYVAEDGRQFSDPEICARYEREMAIRELLKEEELGDIDTDLIIRILDHYREEIGVILIPELLVENN